MRGVQRVLLARAAAAKLVHSVRLFGAYPSLTSVSETGEQMVTDLRQLLRVAYVRMFAYTVVASVVALYSTIFVYDEVLDLPCFSSRTARTR